MNILEIPDKPAEVKDEELMKRKSLIFSQGIIPKKSASGSKMLPCLMIFF